jgi:hypothetical protein
VGHRPITLKLDSNLCLGRREANRGAGGHHEIPQTDGSHPAAQTLQFPHPLS